jgi:sulfate adenylyltransferase large subunit
MSSAPAIGEQFEEFLQNDLDKELLRFTTAGSVDDGKSTLIGRLLHDAKGVYEDQLASVKKSRINRSTGPVDFSLLTDGLRAEREQGITIDVAYRYFATARRKFIIADTPGHEQYTRNMATGASTASLAVILVDATKGLLPQTRRHSYIASLLGIPNLLVAINKMDLVDYSEEVFLRLQGDFLDLANHLKIRGVQCVPVSALEGDNLVDRGHNTQWYSGPTLLEHLEIVPIQPASSVHSMRFPVQYVIRPDSGFRGFAGQVAGGSVRPGDAVMALPSRQTSRVESIVTFDGELDAAVISQSVTLKLSDEIDLSRGDMLVSPHALPSVSTHFSAAVVWLNETPLRLNRTYIAKHTTRQVKAKVTRIEYRVDVNTLAHEPVQELGMNGIAVVEVETSSPLFFDTYESSRTTGSFILVDPLSNATVGAGMIRGDLSRRQPGAGEYEEAALETSQEVVTPQERYLRHGHRSAIFLLGSRDSLRESVERALFDRGFEAILLNNSPSRAGETPALPGQVPDDSILAKVKLLLEVGFVVLLVSGGVSAETRRAIESLAEGSLFDFADESTGGSGGERLAAILLAAESLRLPAGRGNHGKVN